MSPPKADELPQDTAAKLSRRILALESAHAEGTPGKPTSSLTWVVALVLSAIVAAIVAGIAWARKRLKKKKPEETTP